MGVIRKQSISGTIYTYLGVIIRFLTIGLLYPTAFSTEEVGLLRVLVSVSVLFAQFGSLGFNSVTVRLFPKFRDTDQKHNGYLGLAMFIGLIGMGLSMIILFILKPWIIESNSEKSALFVEYFYYLIPLIIFQLYFTILDTYYRVLYDAVKGTIYKEFLQRLFILIVILAYYFGWLEFTPFIWTYIVAIGLPTLLLFIRLASQRRLHLRFNFNILDKQLIRHMTSVSLYGILISFSGVLVLNIDVIMVNQYEGLALAGVYTVTFFFGTLVLIPSRSLNKIGSVIISDAWERKDISQIKDIYYKSSLTLTLVGLWIFAGLWVNLDNIFEIIKDDYLPGKYVILLIGIANLFELASGISNQLMFNTRYYQTLTWLMFTFMLLIVITNMIFIPIYGIIGAALASLISKFIFSLLKYTVLLRGFGYQPITYKHILLLLMFGLAVAISFFIPKLPHYIWDILVRSLIVSIVYLGLAYFTRISEDINQSIQKVIQFIIRR